jgi:hypothetical protein
LLADADPDQISRVALHAGVTLHELRLAHDGNRLEQLFFQLTADDQSTSNDISRLQNTRVPKEPVR